MFAAATKQAFIIRIGRQHNKNTTQAKTEEMMALNSPGRTREMSVYQSNCCKESPHCSRIFRYFSPGGKRNKIFGCRSLGRCLWTDASRQSNRPQTPSLRPRHTQHVFQGKNIAFRNGTARERRSAFTCPRPSEECRAFACLAVIPAQNSAQPDGRRYSERQPKGRRPRLTPSVNFISSCPA